MQRINLDGLPAAERFDAWTMLTEPFFAVSREDEGSAAFRCEMATVELGEALLIHTGVSGQRYEHTMRHARSGGWDQIAFQMYREGSFRGLYGEQSVEAGAGDLNVIDLARPYAKESTDETDFNLIVPREAVERSLPAVRHGSVLRAGEPLARLAAIHLGGMLAAAEQLTAAEGARAVAAFLTLLSGTRLAEAEPEVVPFLRSTARQGAEAVIRRNLARPRLDAERIARACGLSRASLYRLFEPDGGVQAFVRRERLALARRMIEARPFEPLGDIAAACGFNDAAGFSRMFRGAFGISPGELRGEDRQAAFHAVQTPGRWIEFVRRFREDG